MHRDINREQAGMCMFTYTCGMTTDRGDVRKENQDSILALTGNAGGKNAGLFLVADGMGGLSYGALVSQYIVEQFGRWWQEDFHGMIEAGIDSEEDIRELMEQEIWDINQSIYQFKNRLQCRSGSTLSLLLLYGNRYYIENIGDSRIYLMRGGKLKQLTEDQSVVAKMVREQRMSEKEAAHSRMKNMLTMCIGMFEVPQSGYLSGTLKEGDCFLLCSDGFYHPIGNEKMELVLGNTEMDSQTKADCLRTMIETGMATDNVSAVVAGIKRNA